MASYFSSSPPEPTTYSGYVYESIFGAPPPPPSIAEQLSESLSDPRSILPDSCCGAHTLFDSYLGQLTLRAQADLPAAQAAMQTASTTTLAIAGTILLLGRLVGGERWVLSALYTLAGLATAAATAAFVKSSVGAPVESAAFAALGLQGEARCAATLAILILAALTAVSLVQRLVTITFFTSGFALGAKLGALATAEAASLAAPTVFPPAAVYASIGLCGLLGAYAVLAVAPKLIDTSLAAVGATLLAHAALQYHASHAAALAAAYPTLAGLPLQEKRDAYALGLILALLMARGVLLALRKKLLGGGKARSKGLFEESLIAS